MFRKLLVGAGAASVAVAAAIVADAGHLAAYANKLNSAPGLEVNYSVNDVGGTQTKYQVVLSKPNKAYIDMPGKTFVADGKELTVYDKKQNSYFVKAQPADLVPEIMKDEEVSLWRAFFNPKVYDNVASTKNEGTRTRRGETLNTVSAQVDKAGDYTVRLHLSQKDGLPRQAEFVSKTGATEKIRIVNVESINANKPADSMFVFNAPAGAKQLTEADMMSAEWGHDLNKALESAAALGKGVIIDFYADWWTYCTKLKAEVFSREEFKKAVGKDFVLVAVNTDHHPDIARKYGASALPTIVFLNSKGDVIHKFIGYKDYAGVMREVEAARSKL